MEDTLVLARRPPRSPAPRRFGIRDRVCDPFAEAERITVADAFRIHAGIEMLDTLDEKGWGDRDLFATRAKRAGFSIAADDGWSDIFSKVLAAAIEPRLGWSGLRF